MRLSQYWCASQPFAKLLWGLYTLWYSWLLAGLWNWLAPGGSVKLWDLASCWTSAGILLIVGIPPGSKWGTLTRWYLTLRSTLALPTLGSCSKFPSRPSGTCLNSPLRAMLAATLSVGWPTIPRRHGRSLKCREVKGNKKEENKLEGLVGLGIFVLFTLSSSHVI